MNQNDGTSWRICSLGDLAELITKGTTPTTYGHCYVDSGIPFIRIENILDSGVLEFSDVRYISQAAHEALARSKLQAGDLLFSIAGALGRVALVPQGLLEGNTNQAIAIVRLRKASAFGEYVKFALLGATVRKQVKRDHSQLAQANLSLAQVSAFLIPLPPLPEQRRIAHILDTLDEAILRTEQLVAKLQQLKQGLLHDLLTRGVDENGEVRDPEAHPEQFKDSVLGRIPRGWKEVVMASLLAGRPRNGVSPVTTDECTDVSVLGLGCLTLDGFVPSQVKYVPTGFLDVKKYTLANGDLLVSRSNTIDKVGHAGIFRDIGITCIYPDLMMRLSLKEPDSAPFIESSLRSEYVRRQIVSGAAGTSGSMVKINSGTVCGLVIALPPEDEQREILKCIGFTASKIEQEARGATKLRSLKAGLMDDLLTGRVRTHCLGDITP